MGTIIGTPPNAVAAAAMSKGGFEVGFLQWMIVGVPIVCVMLVVLWCILLTIFSPKEEKIEIVFTEKLNITWPLVTVVLTFMATILLWMTSKWNGFPAPVVALLPIMVFTMFGIIDRDDLKKIEWHVLILVAGGMALGLSIQKSGLSEVLVALLPSHLSPMLIVGMFMIFTLVISNFMSNTSASNLIIPIIVSIAVVSPKVGAMAVAFSASLAMSLPISTPPNAIAFATRAITTKEMAFYGTIVSLIGINSCRNSILLFQRCYCQPIKTSGAPSPLKGEGIAEGYLWGIVLSTTISAHLI